MRRVSTLCLVGLMCVASSIGAVSVVQAKELSRQFRMPVTMNVSMQATECTNSPGPQITLEGEMALAGLGLDMIFTNNVKGTHIFDNATSIEAVAVPANQAVSIPKQPVLGGVGGNPFIWLQLFDQNGLALTSEIYMGRCVQGLLQPGSQAFGLPVVATVRLETSECSNNPGPYITMDGDMVMSGLNAQLIFRNNDNPVGGPHSATDETRMNMVLLPPGLTEEFPKQPVLGGVGGNPYIWAQFLQDNGDTIGKKVLMGRCVQLSQQ